MEAVAPDEKPKQPLVALSGPPPQPAHQPPLSDTSHGLRHPPRLYEPASGRPYPPYEGGNPDQRGHPPYTAPPRENTHSHPQDMYQRPGSLPGHSRPPDSNFRPINGDGNPPVQGPGWDFRTRLPHPTNDSHPNGEPPPHGMPMMQHHPDGMQTPLAHRQFPPPTPLSHPSHAGYEPNSYFMSQSGGPFSAQRQRRTTRAQQACDQCRARKAKCDEGRPSCTHCKDNNVQCVYKDVPPHKHERATQMVLDKLQDIADKLQVVDDVLQTQSSFGQKLDLLMEKKVEASTSSPPKDTSTAVETKGNASASKVTNAEPPQETPSDPSSQKQGADDEEVKKELAVDDEELSIPIEHTTAAHKLLWWPSIQKLLPEKVDDDYVMELEETRGPIRPYGRGEGDEGRIPFNRQPDSPMMTTSPQEEETYHAVSPGTRFGTGLEFYQSYQQSSKAAKDPHVDALQPPGTLNLDADTIRMYKDSYVKNMHVLHPFLGLATLESMVANFTQTYSPPKRKFSSQFVQVKQTDSSAPLSRAPKRKRSVDVSSKFPAGVDSPLSDHSVSGQNFTAIHRSMDNAIVLLVLSLGAICCWKRDIPGPIHDPPPKNSLFAPLAGVSPILAESTFANPSPFHSPTDNFTTSGRRHSHPPGSNSANDAPEQNLKNMDVVPGMAYYAIASDILGNLQGGNDLSHAQACLLAALYTGQLAHPFSSHGWISQAARACQVLVRPRRFSRMPDGPVKDLICFVFWTCLQLESDILAELDLPASGISRLEGRMDFPKGMFAHSIPNEIDSPITMIMYYYSAQIHLRKVLNRVHTDLYKAEKQNPGESNKKWSTTIQEVLNVNLEQWRAGLPAHMRWDDKDEPSNNINIARLRAKYYGARYIIHRPLLHHALHPMAPKPPVQAPAESPALSAVSSSQSHPSPSVPYSQHSEPMERWASDMGPPPRVPSSQDPQPSSLADLDPKIREACVVCIEAAMNSTTAFDGIDGRPIVTNIFGTAHAQFGNMLVLAATYTSKLSSLVDGERLRKLLNRTIDFLWQSRYISPTLRKDAEILSLIRHKLFDQQPVATSFSSNDG